jgi:hypothetical protein
MKRNIALVISDLFVISMQVVAQSRPIMGYDQVVWGTSVSDVRRAYNIADSVSLAVDEQDANLRYLIQEGVSDSISRRKFYFKDDKLYRVWVIYNGQIVPRIIYKAFLQIVSDRQLILIQIRKKHISCFKEFITVQIQQRLADIPQIFLLN